MIILQRQLGIRGEAIMNIHILFGSLAFLWPVYITTAYSNHMKTISTRQDLGLKDVPEEKRTSSGNPCSVKYIKVGCYNDKRKTSSRAMRELLFQDRYKGKTFSGQKIDWKNYNKYLPDLVCRCAVATSNRGYVFFGIQFYGECWSSADAAQRFFIYHPNDKCVNTEYKPCDKASDNACAGVAHMNYVYEIVPASPDGSGVGPPVNPEEY
ncbi:uncharacterized protein LOC144658501 isoform X1 [Oculina patagonica]